MGDVGRVIGTVVSAGMGAMLGFALGGPIGAFKGAAAGAALFLRLTDPKSGTYRTGGVTTQADPNLPVPIIYGKVKAGGNVVYEKIKGDVRERVLLIAYGEGEIDGFEDVKINGQAFDTFTSWPNISTKTEYLGTADQALDARVDGGVSTLGGLKRVAYLALTLKKSGKLDLSSRPAVTAIVRGRQVRQWTGEAWTAPAWSDNPVWCLLDLMLDDRYGAGFAESQLDLESFRTAAAYCDEIVAISGQKRFTLNLCIDWQEPFVDTIDRIRAVFRGYFVYVNGQTAVKIEQAEGAVQAFTDEDIVPGSLQLTVASRDDLYDRVRVKFYDKIRDYAEQIATAGPGPSGTRMPNELEVTQLGVDNWDQASRLAYFFWASSAMSKQSGTCKTTLRALDRTPGDVVTLTTDVFGWNAVPVRIMSLKSCEDNTIEISFRRYVADIYLDKQGSAPPPDPPAPGTGGNTPPPPPREPIDREEPIQYPDLPWVGPIVVIEWGEPEYLNHDRVIVELSENGGDFQVEAESYGTSVRIGDLKSGVTYQARLTNVSVTGLRSDPVTLDPIALPQQEWTIPESRLSDTVRKRVWSSNPAPIAGDIGSIHDGSPVTSASFSAGTVITVRDAFQGNHTHLQMFAAEAGKRFYVQAVDLSGVVTDVLGSAAAPVETVATIHGYEYVAPIEACEIRVSLVDVMEIRELRPADMVSATNVYADRVIAGIGGGLILRDDPDFSGLDVRGDDNESIARFGRVPDGLGGHKGLAELIDSRGRTVFTRDGGLQVVTPDGATSDMLYSKKQMLTPASYVVEGCAIRAGQMAALSPVQMNRINDVFPNSCEPIMTAATFGLHRDSTYGIVCALLKTELPSLPVGATLVRARMRMAAYKTDSSLVSRARASKITSAWNPATVTYGNQPPTEATYYEKEVPAKYVGLVDIDITPIVQSWLAVPASNYGIMLFNWGGEFSLYGMGAQVPADRPQLIVEYTTSTANTLNVDSGKVSILDNYLEYPGGSIVLNQNGTLPIALGYEDFEWFLTTIPTSSTVILGTATVSNGVITGVSTERNSGRKTGTYDRGRLWGNRFHSTGWLQVSGGNKIERPHPLGTDDVMFIAKVKFALTDPVWTQMEVTESSGAESGCLIRVGVDTIIIQAGATRPFLNYTDFGQWENRDPILLKVDIFALD